MQRHVHLPDASDAAEAAALIAHFGPAAASEATARADQSRAIGNLVHFCRWRQIARLIALLDQGSSGATIH